MRIAYLTETFPPEINGVALTSERVCRALRRSGHDVLLVRPRQRGEAARDDAQEWLTAGAPIPLYPQLQFGWVAGRELQRRWRAWRPDVVHAVTPGPLGWLALRSARALGIPTSSDFRTDFSAYAHHYGLGWAAPLVTSWMRKLNALSDATFVPTAALARSLGRAGFARLQVCGRGVDALRFDPRQRDLALRLSWGATDDDVVLLSVGRVASEKNVALALRAFEAVRLRVPRARMVVVGDGPLRRPLALRHPEVRFVGAQRDGDLARHFASADVFLFPSMTDTFGNVTLEALASGLSVVAFDVAAAAEHVLHAHDGWLVPPGDEAAYVAAVVRAALLGTAPYSGLRERPRQAALMATWERATDDFERALRRVAAPPATLEVLRSSGAGRAG